MQFVSLRFFRIVFTLVVLTCCPLAYSQAQDRSNLGDIYREQYLNTNQDVETSQEDQKNILSTPVELSGGSTLTIVYPQKWSKLANKLKGTLQESHQLFQKLFGEFPALRSSLRIMDEDVFYLSTGAPSWTNALFYKGQIMIPVSDSKDLDLESIIRSVKHEYTHAVIHAMSDGKCPGWLDEGLAQWAEGSENPALQPALYNYLRKSSPVPLALLQNGFTKLDTKMVPAAYAQSLYATHTLMNTFGISKIGKYLVSLRDNAKPFAFNSTFSMPEDTFEKRLGGSLKKWSKEYLPNQELRLVSN